MSATSSVSGPSARLRPRLRSSCASLAVPGSRPGCPLRGSAPASPLAGPALLSPLYIDPGVRRSWVRPPLPPALCARFWGQFRGVPDPPTPPGRCRPRASQGAAGRALRRVRRDDVPLAGRVVLRGGASDRVCLGSVARLSASGWWHLPGAASHARGDRQHTPPVAHESTGGVSLPPPCVASPGVLHVVPRGTRGVSMRNVTLYLSDDLVRRARAAAVADHRSLSVWLTIRVEQALVHLPAAGDRDLYRPAAHQVDLEELVEASKRRRPSPAARSGRRPRRPK